MEPSTRVIGTRERCTAKESLSRRMAVSIRAPSLMTRKRDMENITGVMVGPTKENGKLESSMGSGCSLKQMAGRNVVDGMMVSGLHGLTD